MTGTFYRILPVAVACEFACELYEQRRYLWSPGLCFMHYESQGTLMHVKSWLGDKERKQ